MTPREAARTAIRRRAIAEGWPATLLAIAEDFADTANDDGTHALRSRPAQAEALGISEATVKRHRASLSDMGVFVLRRQGGNGRGASVFDFGPSVLDGRTPEPPSSGSTSGATVTPNSSSRPDASSGSQPGADVTPDPASSGSVVGQSRVTATPDRDPVLLSSRPEQAASSKEPDVHTDPDATSPTPIEQIATAYDTDTDTAAALLAIAEKDTNIHNPAGYLLAGTEWTSSQRMLQQAREQLTHAAAQQERAARESAAEAELGPRPTGRGLEELTYAWDVAATAYRKRDQRPAQWRHARTQLLDVQTRYDSQHHARPVATAWPTTTTVTA